MYKPPGVYEAEEPKVGYKIVWHPEKLPRQTAIKVFVPPGEKYVVPEPETGYNRSRKVRAGSIFVAKTTPITMKNAIYSGATTRYPSWSIVEADSLDTDIREICTNGIHFFPTKNDAENWI